MNQRFLDPCQFYGDGHGGRPRNSAYTWAAIPKGRQGKDRRGSGEIRFHVRKEDMFCKFKHREEQHFLIC